LQHIAVQADICLDNIDQIVDENIDDNVFHEGNYLFVLVAGLHSHISNIRQYCYLCERFCRRNSVIIFEEDLATNDAGNSWMSEDEFLCMYKVNQEQTDRSHLLLPMMQCLLKPGSVFLRCL
jgi:hypothetical protein